MNLDYLFCERLKTERKRLGLNQSEAGLVVGVSREMWGKYERGAKPGGDVFIAMQKHGFNINYILAGSNLLDVKISPNEVDLLDKFRLSNELVQQAVINLLEATNSTIQKET